MNARPVYEPVGGGVAAGLLADGSLTIEYDPVLRSVVEPWIPRLAAGSRAAAGPHPHIRVHTARGDTPPPELGAPTFHVRQVRAWMDLRAERAVVADEHRLLGGTVDLQRLHTTILLDPDATSEPFRIAVSDVLTIAAALMLMRSGRLLIHAGAVVAPDGRAWLLVGDSFSGKTSTCANLIRAGWDYLADDQVVVRAGGRGAEMTVEGWPREFNLDEGFAAGVSVGRRTQADPAALGPGRPRPKALLGGLLLPQVLADEPTVLERAAPADALAALIRQAPWLLADPPSARATLRTMSGMATTPSFRLRLGYDSYRDPDRLESILLSQGAV